MNPSCYATLVSFRGVSQWFCIVPDMGAVAKIDEPIGWFEKSINLESPRAKEIRDLITKWDEAEGGCIVLESEPIWRMG